MFLTGLLLTYCRVQACLLALPVFSERLLPVRVRVALAMSLTPLLAEHVALGQNRNGRAAWHACGRRGGHRSGAGRTGASFRDCAGCRRDGDRGDGLAVATGWCATNEYSPHPIGSILHLAGLALIMALGFPVLVCQLLRESFQLRPLGAWPISPSCFRRRLPWFSAASCWRCCWRRRSFWADFCSSCCRA
jgi:flagellar biosynthetic protein FliR